MEGRSFKRRSCERRGQLHRTDSSTGEIGRITRAANRDLRAQSPDRFPQSRMVAGRNAREFHTYALSGDGRPHDTFDSHFPSGTENSIPAPVARGFPWR